MSTRDKEIIEYLRRAIAAGVEVDEALRRQGFTLGRDAYVKNGNLYIKRGMLGSKFVGAI